jgi:acyl carrier protein
MRDRLRIGMIATATIWTRVRFLNDFNDWASAPRGATVTMETAEIYTRLAEIFRDVFDEDSIEVTPELSAKDVDGWDSLTHIRLILTVEKAFKINFSTSEIGKLENVDDLVALIQARV